MFLYAILAGVSIGIGGVMFLACDNKVVGAFFFSVGLFVVCTHGLNLYTGKVAYLFDNKPAYLIDLVIIWLGNLVGTWLIGTAVRLTRVAPAYIEKAQGMAEAKLGDGMLSLFLLGLLCNVLIYIGVDGYKNNPHEVGKYLAILFGVTVFIVCGFEHSVADMFYFVMAGVLWQPRTWAVLGIVTLGNAVGGVIFPVARMWKRRVDAAN